MAKNTRSSIGVDRDTAAVFKAAADKVRSSVGELLRFAAMKPVFMESLLRVYVDGAYAENLGLLKPGRRAASESSSASGSSAASPAEPRSSGMAASGSAPASASSAPVASAGSRPASSAPAAGSAPASASSAPAAVQRRPSAPPRTA